MLKYLTLTNVRKHESTHLDFTGDGQLISLAGLNGAGKSTVLEAILYALYGETRHGRSGIANMVRRGAEHEGMEVSLGFSLDSVDYEVTRRYEKGKSTASLKAGGKETMRSVGSVTSEISRILGMDATGFKLATIAKQKELDGLAELTATKRRAAVARLLRLDAISGAAKNAREEYVRAKELAEALSAQADVSAAKSRLEEAELAGQESANAAEEQRKVVDELRKVILDASEVAEEWERRQREASIAQAKLESARESATSLESQISQIVIPDQPEEFVPSHVLQAQVEQATAQVALAEEAARAQQTRARLERDIERASALLSELEESCASAQTVRKASKSALERLEKSQEKERTAAARVASLDGDVRVFEEGVRVAGERTARLEDLGGVCSLCEQPVSAEHKVRQEAQAAAELADAKGKVEKAREDLRAARESLTEAEAEVSRAGKEARAAQDALVKVEQDCSTFAEVSTSVHTYKETLERIPQAPGDVDELYAAKARLEAQRAASLEAERVLTARKAGLASKAGLEKALEGAVKSAQEAQEALDKAMPDAELTSAFDTLRTNKESLAVETEILAACTEAAQEAAGAVRAAKAAVSAAEALGEQAELTRSQALVAARAHEVLSAMARTLSTEIRPALQAEVSTLLASLSEGRFTAVEVSEDYSVSVQDNDSKMHPVGEFSGGEADLIALAIRLALAQIVAKRNGAHASGFLILDEVLGSQDAGRRWAILEGLRRLRSTYGQILLISHVGGLEDASDRVITIEEVDGVAIAS